MPAFRCPVCGGELTLQEKSYLCPNGHCHDRAKHGYVNLLMSNRPSDKRHGDDKLMVQSRKSFLDKGYYLPLREELCRLAAAYCPPNAHVLDVGCGEGWYTSALRHALPGSRVCGVDISRQALIEAARRDKELSLAVASINALPVMDESCDLLLNVFAPNDDREFARVLKRGGYLMKAVPLERHLFGLKSAVYEKPYLNPPAVYEPEGFTPVLLREISYTLTLENNADINALFMMTPYYYKTGRQDQEKLKTLNRLETEVCFGLFLLKKN